MLRLLRLYTEPAVIDPVSFRKGINIILGEKSESSNKTNGVGKSLCIEFINFALFKGRAHSRVARIPKDVLHPSVAVCLDFELHGLEYTIKRSLDKAENPTMVVDGRPQVFDKLEDAAAFLTQRLFSALGEAPSPTFRAMMGPLIRDERSEFKSLVQCYDTKLRLAGDVEPHLYLFGIDLSL